MVAPPGDDAHAQLAGHDHRAGGRAVGAGRQHDEAGPAGPQRRGDVRRPRRTGAQHRHVDAGDAALPRPGQDGAGAGPAVELDDAASARVPEHRPGAQLVPGRAGRAAAGGQGDRGDHDRGHRSGPERHLPAPAATPGQPDRGGTGPGDPHRRHHDRQHREVGRTEVAERPARGGPGHPVEPGQQQPGRQVQHRGHRPAEDAGDEARRQAPDHDRPGHGDREQVRRHRGERHRAERRHQQRRHGHLRGQGDRQRGGQPAGAGQRVGEAGSADHDAGGARHGQAEPERRHEQRVDEHHAGHAQGQRPQRRGRAPDRSTERRDRGHRRGPQDRRLAAGEEREAGEHPQRDHQPGPEAEPRQQGRRDDQGEGDVLPAHGEQVGEPGAAEGVGHVGRLVAVVAEGDAREQAAVPLRQRRRAGGQRAADAVGRPGDRVARPPARDRRDLEAAGQMPVAGPSFGGARRSHGADDGDPLAHEPVVERCGRRVAGMGREPAPAEADVGARPARRVGHGIADEGDLGPDGTGGQRCPEPVERALGQGHGEQPGREHEHLGPEPAEAAEHPGPGQHDQPRRERHPADVAVDRSEGRGERDHGEDDGPAIRHGPTAPPAHRR